MTALPLIGRRVVVTRASAQAGSLAAMLREQGAEVVEAALIEIVDPPDGGRELQAALAHLDRYDWVVVTSPNGAARVAPALLPFAGGAPRHTRVAAVGSATAAATGVEVDLVPDRQTADSLLAAFPPGTGRLLLVQGDLAEPVLRDGLVAIGWEVDAVVGYTTVPRRPTQAERDEVAASHVVTFASGSAVRAFVSAFGTDRCPPCVVTIGPVTSAIAQDMGLAVTASANPHTLPALIQAVIEATRVGRPE